MEVMPYHIDVGVSSLASQSSEQWLRAQMVESSISETMDWQAGLPILRGLRLTLRELRREDAPALLAHLTTEQVTRFISPPPTTLAGFEQFIAWTHRQRAQGRYMCLAVVPNGQTTPVGLFQVHLTDPEAGTAEWGFVLGSAYWGF